MIATIETCGVNGDPANRGRYRMKKRRQSYLSGLLTDFDYLTAPVKPDRQVLETLVQQYRDGDNGVAHKIIQAHLHIVAALVGNFARRRNVDEILGEAMLALVDAVRRAQQALIDNEITPYIASMVKDRIAEIVSRDRAVYMPLRTLRYKAAKGEINRDGNFDPIIIGVVSLNAVVMEDVEGGDDSEYVDECRSPNASPHTIPIARAEEPSVEFREALAMSIKTTLESRVIQMRAEGYRNREMRDILKINKDSITYHVRKVRQRFERLYA